jgi:hypothetical protein
MCGDLGEESCKDQQNKRDLQDLQDFGLGRGIVEI